MRSRINDDHTDFEKGEDEQSSCRGPICPHCGHLHDEDLAAFEDPIDDYECEHCGLAFEVWPDTTTTYYSRKVVE